MEPRSPKECIHTSITALRPAHACNGNASRRPCHSHPPPATHFTCSSFNSSRINTGALTACRLASMTGRRSIGHVLLARKACARHFEQKIWPHPTSISGSSSVQRHIGHSSVSEMESGAVCSNMRGEREGVGSREARSRKARSTSSRWATWGRLGMAGERCCPSCSANCFLFCSRIICSRSRAADERTAKEEILRSFS